MTTDPKQIERPGRFWSATTLLSWCLILLAPATCGCGSGIRFVELRQARLDGNHLSLIVDDYVKDPFEHTTVWHQYLVTFLLEGPDASPRQLALSEFPPDFHGEDVMIGAQAASILQIWGLGLTVIDDKVYPVAALRVLTYDRTTGNWVERCKWNRMPFFVDPDMTRLLVRQPEGIRAYTLPTGERTKLDGADALFSSIGSFHDPLLKLVLEGADSPPDYDALTSDWDYASADGNGNVFAMFIYEHGRRNWHKLPYRVDVPGFGQVWINEVRRNGDRWEFRCLREGPMPPTTSARDVPHSHLGMLVVTEDMKEVRGVLPVGPDVRLFVASGGKWWDPRQRVMLAWDVNENALQTGRFTLKLWRYSNPQDAQRMFPITIDVQNILKLPPPPAPRARPH